MKRIFVTYGCVTLFLVTGLSGLKSQDFLSGHPIEKIRVCADRSLYINGENILFSAFISNEQNIPAGNNSRVLYNELITPDGNRITGGKYTIENSSSQGCIQIPEETVTGIYFLRSYTRFMRNGDPGNYHYIMLKIINPYKTEMLAGYDNVEMAPVQITNIPERSSDQSLNLIITKKNYHPREDINLKIVGTKIQEVGMRMCMSVVPVGSEDSISCGGNFITSGGDSISTELRYYPEPRGISLSGRLLESETGAPVPNALVNLSIIGDKDVMAIRTNSTGQFYFALPGFSGNRDIFLCVEDIPGISASVFIDNDFCTKPVNLPVPAFHLTETEKETLLKLAVNQKLTSVFLNGTAPVKPEPPHDSTSFYGEPDEILVMEKYIDLPTIEDYFEELLGAVNVRKYEGRKIFRFNSARTEMTIYDPLVLIDWVAVDDIDRILAMSPKAIDRIELVNAPYIKGNVTYGGIISFVSKKNDFAGIDLPASGTFINYKFLEACSGNNPAYPLPVNLPDSRNTIYWNPDVRLNDEGESDIQFTAPDTPGKYIIVLRGMGLPEERVICREVIEVVAE